MEQAWSNIAVQRTIDDHTRYMIRARTRTKFKIGRETTEYWSASNIMWQFRLLHPTRMWGVTRDGHGYHHLPPTPQPESRKCIHLSLHTQAPCLRTQKLPKFSWVPDPMDRRARIWANPKERWTTTSTLALLLLIQIIWMIKHKVLHVNIITHKLYASSYIMIITWEL